MIQYFGSRDRMTAEYFSKLCGVTTIWNMSTAIARAFGQNSGGSGGGSTSTTTTTTDTANGTQRQLAYPDELMRLPKNRQLLLIENMNPILAGKTPWFKDPHLKDKGVNLYAENTAQTKPSNTASTEA
jgi:type IV secretion system protein VirD4